MHLTSIIANIIMNKIFYYTLSKKNYTNVSYFLILNIERSRRNWFVIICT
jgi:hypothetical protein